LKNPQCAWRLDIQLSCAIEKQAADPC
jgi:hypothetical protein